jgi:hypothetical protein
MQHEIKNSQLLLDEDGNIKEPGFAKTLLPIYERSQIKAGSLRIKEWDYYLIANDHFAVALTISDNSYMGLDSVSFLNFDEHWEKTRSFMQAFTLGKKQLSSTSASGDISVKTKKYQISFVHTQDKRILSFSVENFKDSKPISGMIELTQEPEESMVIATPFDKKGHFYFNQKINCLRANGRVQVGKTEYLFHEDHSFAVLDWGRGVWTYRNTWYWGSASGLADLVPFGFNLGYGFGNTEAATENMIFYDGKAHKISEVTFLIPMKSGRSTLKEDYLKPWKFTSDDKRFEMYFKPIMIRKARASFFAIKSDQNQVFGKYSGKAVLDDGRVIEVNDFIGFAEKVSNKW